MKVLGFGTTVRLNVRALHQLLNYNYLGDETYCTFRTCTELSVDMPSMPVEAANLPS